MGGTKIEAIALDDFGKEVLRRRVSTPRDDYQGCLNAIVELVRNFEAELHTPNLKIGLGTPGALSKKTGLMKNSNSTWLLGKPMLADLKRQLGDRVRMANDANCFCLSEAVDGAAQDSDVVFGVIIGTGTGGGLSFQKKIHEGADSIAGEWGHNGMPWMQADEFPGRDCYCGKKGCIETFLSGPGLSAEHLQRTGAQKSAAEIAKLAEESKEQTALASLRIYESRLARALASVINIFDPDAIVLGGGLSNIQSIYENVPRLWKPFVFSDEVQTKLVRAKYGDSSGVRGAAWLWP